MPTGVKITAEQEEEIIAALTAKSHALQVARDTGWSFATVWRVADRADIDLRDGRAARGYKRLAPELWAKVAATLAANPRATQQEVARKTDVSRSTVGRIKRAQQRDMAVHSHVA
jgi:DNA invertase Pin-like site-specific DNA recombinase